MIVLLDSGPLGRLTSPKATRANLEYHTWVQLLLKSHVRVLVPEICDYEIRRELLRRQRRGERVEALGILDGLRRSLGFLPLDSSIMLRAAELWADARNAGQPTAPPDSLDCDVILAAQAIEVGGVIATENVGHLSRYGVAKYWRDVTPNDQDND
jgi:predicted nucleic acid-binding protein